MRRLGRIEDPAATELSGLVVSRTQPGVLWTHNDSGDAPRILAVRPGGLALGSYSVTGAQAVDWEDIATAPGPGGRGADLFVGDIGDNDERRAEVVVYRFREPDTRSRGGATASARPLVLGYPDGPHDAEALLVDPLRGDLVIVTKSLDGVARVYRAPARVTASGAPAVLRRAGRIVLGVGQPITAGDVSPDGLTVVLRTYDRLLVWPRRPGVRLDRALRRAPCASTTPLREGQGEAVALLPGARAALTVTEGPRPVVRRYSPRRAP